MMYTLIISLLIEKRAGVVNRLPGRGLTGYPLGFHRLVTMNQTSPTRVIKSRQGVRPEHVLSLEIESFLHTTETSDLVLISLLDDFDVRRRF